jgi:hypothetical protein
MNDEGVGANEPTGTARIIETLNALDSVRAPDDSDQEGVDDCFICWAHARLKCLKIPYELRREGIGPHDFLLRREI